MVSKVGQQLISNTDAAAGREGNDEVLTLPSLLWQSDDRRSNGTLDDGWLERKLGMDRWRCDFHDHLLGAFDRRCGSPGEMDRRQRGGRLPAARRGGIRPGGSQEALRRR